MTLNLSFNLREIIYFKFVFKGIGMEQSFSMQCTATDDYYFRRHQFTISKDCAAVAQTYLGTDNKVRSH